MNSFNTPINLTAQLAVVAPVTHHQIEVNPNNGLNTGVAPVSWPNYLGGGVILLLLVGMLGVARKSTTLVNRRERVLADMGKIHHDNLLKNLEHRMQVARSRGDQNLVQLLEQERKQLV